VDGLSVAVSIAVRIREPERRKLHITHLFPPQISTSVATLAIMRAEFANDRFDFQA
jgi:hypothetical protein